MVKNPMKSCKRKPSHKQWVQSKPSDFDPRSHSFIPSAVSSSNVVIRNKIWRKLNLLSEQTDLCFNRAGCVGCRTCDTSLATRLSDYFRRPRCLHPPQPPCELGVRGPPSLFEFWVGSLSKMLGIGITDAQLPSQVRPD